MNQPYGYTPTPPRSAIPKVIGILMIIFGSLGILAGLIGLASGPDKTFAHIEEWRKFESVTQMLGLIGFPITILGFVTGILAVKYKAIAPKLAAVYGGIGIIHTLVNGIVVYTYMKKAMDAVVGDFGGRMDSAVQMGMNVGMVFGMIVGLAWPIVILVLMTRPNAKAACVN
jgi:hypothetical protein